MLSECISMFTVDVISRSTYLMKSQRVAVSRRHSVDGGVQGQPALATEVIPAERKQKGEETMTEQL